MNKKGFTLIEVLAVITIIGLVATMISTNIIKYLEESEKYEKETLDNIYITASKLYLNMKENKDFKKECQNNGCKITTDTLLKKDLLDKEDITTKKEIVISFEKNEFIYKLKEVD